MEENRRDDELFAALQKAKKRKRVRRVATVLVIVGIAIGQVFDGNPKIINAIRGLFESDRSRQ